MLYRSKMQSPASRSQWSSHESPMMTAKHQKSQLMVKMVEIRAAETHLLCGMNARLHAELDISSGSRGQIS